MAGVAAGMLSGGNAGKFGIEIDWHPTPFILAAQFQVLGLNVKSFHEPLKRSVQQVMAPSIRKNFEVEGRPAWAPLTDTTNRLRSYYGFTPAHPILGRTGRLKRIAGQLNVWNIDREQAYAQGLPGAWYGMMHQLGYAAGGGSKTTSMPAGLSNEQQLRWARQQRLARQASGGTAGQAKASGGSGIPARPFLIILQEDVDNIEKVFVEWFQERCTRVGFVPGVG